MNKHSSSGMGETRERSDFNETNSNGMGRDLENFEMRCIFLNLAQVSLSEWN
jgi:hypothetical protein